MKKIKYYTTGIYLAYVLLTWVVFCSEMPRDGWAAIPAMIAGLPWTPIGMGMVRSITSSPPDFLKLFILVPILLFSHVLNAFIIYKISAWIFKGRKKNAQ